MVKIKYYVLVVFLLVFQVRMFSNIDLVKLKTNIENSKNLLSQTPVTFIMNKGQVDGQVKFYVRNNNSTLWIKKDGFVFDTISTSIGKRTVIYMTFLNINKKVSFIKGKRLNGQRNYFKGNDKKKWVKNISGFDSIIYKNLYRGIDLKIYGTRDGKIEYDWILSPMAKLNDIRIKIDGLKDTSTVKNGVLSLKHILGVYRHKVLSAYQIIKGKKKIIKAGFYNINKNIYGISVEKYNKNHSLIIDPVIEQKYSTYLGGNEFDSIKSIAVDSSGYVYVTGITGSSNFPTTSGVYDTSRGDGEYDIFVSKFSKSANSLIFSTFIGGCCRDYASGIAIDVSGYVYITGYTESRDFPVTDSYQKIYGGGKTDVIVVKLDKDGSSLKYSTFIGGCDDDYGMGIATDSNSDFCSDNEGNAYITGYTNGTDFPVSETTYQKSSGGGIDAFVTKLSDDGSDLTYSTYLGGTLDDYGKAIAVDCCKEASVTGNTYSNDFPTSSAFQKSSGGDSDVYLTKFSSDGDTLKYSTYLGGTGSEKVSTVSMCMNCCGYTYIAGQTSSTDFPTQSPYQSSYAGGYSDGFIAMFTKTGSLSYSTYFGGKGRDVIKGLSLDSSRNIFITGNTDSDDIPTLNACQNDLINSKNDIFVSMLSQSGANLLFSSYYGGSGHDISYGISVGCCGGIYIGGETDSTDFPLKNSYQNKYKGGSKDGFITKFYYLPEDSITLTYPNGNELLERGNSYSITWDYLALNRDLTIELYYDGVFHSTIAKTNIDGKSYSWQIPNSLKVDNKYQIRLYSGAVEDFSDISFSIIDTRPTVSIEAVRKREYFWIVEKEYAELKINVENASSALIAKYHIYRKEISSTYEVIKKLTKSELEYGDFVYKDKYIDKDKTYKYKIIAYDSDNNQIGVSNEISI